MGEDNHIEIRFPKGKITPKQIAIICIFIVFIYFMSENLKSVFIEGFENPNYALLTIALILLVIGGVAIYAVRSFSKEHKEQRTS